MFSGLQGGATKQDKKPREENFWDMWKFTFCGNFRPQALPFVMFVIMTVVYVASLIISETSYRGLNNYIFLGPNLSLLNDWGAKNSY